MTSGKVVEVVVEYAGTTVEGDHLAAVTVLNVADVLDFDEDGGRLSIDYDDGAVEHDYTSVDEDALTVTLATPLADPVDDDTAIHLIPLAPEVTASVALGVETGDTIEGVIVPHHLVPLLPEGIRDPEDAESVELESLGAGEWSIKDVVGRETRISTEDTVISTADSGLRTQLDAIGLRTFNDNEVETARLTAASGGMRFGGLVEMEDFLHVRPGIKVVNPNTGFSDGELIAANGRGDGYTLRGYHADITGYGSLYLRSSTEVSVIGVPLSVLTPTQPEHAATKAYVDANAGGGGDTGWVNLPLQSGFTGDYRYRQIGKMVQIIFDISGSIVADTLLGNGPPAGGPPGIIGAQVYIDPPAARERGAVYVDIDSGNVRGTAGGGGVTVTRVRGGASWFVD